MGWACKLRSVICFLMAMTDLLKPGMAGYAYGKTSCTLSPVVYHDDRTTRIQIKRRRHLPGIYEVAVAVVNCCSSPMHHVGRQHCLLLQSPAACPHLRHVLTLPSPGGSIPSTERTARPKRLVAPPAADRRSQALNSLDSLEVAVPEDQRPVNELTALKQAWLYSWATLPLNGYIQRLTLVFAFFFTFIGCPIANQTFEFTKQPVEFILSASTGSFLVVAVAMVRIYLGWSYVGNRLLSASVPYEETGWYDGQLFVKPPEILTRDRLLARYEVYPVLDKMRSTLVGMAGLLLTTSVVLYGLIQAGTDADGVYGRGSRTVRAVTSDGVLFGSRVKDLSQLANDDELAAEEAAAQRGVPGYCADRLLRAYAGGQYCSKFEP